MSSCSYNRAFLTEFIELYRQSPALWKVKSKLYRNKREKLRAYQRLIACLKTVDEAASVERVRRKVNIIRSCFRKEHNKVLMSRRDGLNENYEPSLWYYNLLLFTLKDHDSDQDEDNYSVEEPKYPFLPVTSEVIPAVPTTSGPNISAQPSFRILDATTIKENKIHTSIQKAPPIQETYKTVKTEREDEYDIVGCNVAHKLRRMNATQREYAEQLINNVLFYGILNKLDDVATVSLRTSHPNNQSSFASRNCSVYQVLQSNDSGNTFFPEHQTPAVTTHIDMDTKPNNTI